MDWPKSATTKPTGPHPLNPTLILGLGLHPSGRHLSVGPPSWPSLFLHQSPPTADAGQPSFAAAFAAAFRVLLLSVVFFVAVFGALLVFAAVCLLLLLLLLLSAAFATFFLFCAGLAIVLRFSFFRSMNPTNLGPEGIFSHTPQPHIVFCAIFVHPLFPVFELHIQIWVIFVRRRLLTFQNVKNDPGQTTWPVFLEKASPVTNTFGVFSRKASKRSKSGGEDYSYTAEPHATFCTIFVHPF